MWLINMECCMWFSKGRYYFYGPFHQNKLWSWRWRWGRGKSSQESCLGLEINRSSENDQNDELWAMEAENHHHVITIKTLSDMWINFSLNLHTKQTVGLSPELSGSFERNNGKFALSILCTNKYNHIANLFHSPIAIHQF